MITGEDTRRAIVSGLELDSASKGINVIKQAVTHALVDSDSTVTIRWTDYFNHAFAPDMVLSWPDGSIKERLAYLRLTDRPDELAEDLSAVSEHHPIIFGLSGTDGNEARSESLPILDSAATEARGLFLDPWSVAPLTDSSRPSHGLLGGALLRGGRRALDERRSLSLVAGVNDGLGAALQGEATSTSRAVNLLDEYLGELQAGPIIRFLQALWMGSGQSASDFPGGHIDEFGSLADESLRFLLSWDVEIEDANFWRRSAVQVTVAQLARLRTAAATPNMQHLLRVMLNELLARTVAVQRGQASFSTTQGLLWSVRSGMLCLSGSDFDAFFGEKSDDLASMKRRVDGEATGISVDELRRRAGSVALSEIVLRTGNETVTWRSESDSDLKASDRLAAMIASLGYGTTAASAVAVGSRPLECDLVKRTATTGNRSMVPLGEFMRAALPIIWGLAEVDQVLVSQLLREAPESGGQQDLFGPDLN
ncbi:MAG: hypothetical protein WBA45_15605 [Microthrixaceae bacterium]